MLRLQATKDSRCGQVAKMDLIELPRGNGVAVEYAVVTGILLHNPGDVKGTLEVQATPEPQKASSESAVGERKRPAEDSSEKVEQPNSKKTRTSQRRVSGRKRKSSS